MRPWKLAAIFACLCFGQAPANHAPNPFSVDPDIHLTRAQRSALVKDEHRKSVEDAAALVELAYRLQRDLAKDDSSPAIEKEMEEIQHRAKNIRGRLMRN